VILAISPALAAGIQYAPKLTTQRAQFLPRYPMGSLIKAEAVYSQPFLARRRPLRSVGDGSGPRTQYLRQFSPKRAFRHSHRFCRRCARPRLEHSSADDRRSLGALPRLLETPLSVQRNTSSSNGPPSNCPVVDRSAMPILACCSITEALFANPSARSTGPALKRQPSGTDTWKELFASVNGRPRRCFSVLVDVERGTRANNNGDGFYANFRTSTKDYLKRWNLYRSERAAGLHTYACATSVEQACQLKFPRR
jgi:hypothetical protein